MFDIISKLYEILTYFKLSNLNRRDLVVLKLALEEHATECDK